MFSRPAFAAFAAALAITACSGADISIDGPSATETGGTPAPTSADTDDGLDVPASVGLVTVGGEDFELEFDCYAPGPGEVIAVGSADFSDGRRVEAYVQSFDGSSYVGVSISDATTVLYEAAVDRPLVITHVEGVVRADDIALVTDLNFETGIGIDAGTGSIVVECLFVSVGLPDGVAAG